MLAQGFFAFLILNVVFRFEHNTITQYIGAGCMLVGACIALWQSGTFVIDQGALWVILATAFTPLGNWFAKQATKEVSPHFLMLVRSFIAGLFLVAVGSMFENSVLSFDSSTVLFLVINGILLLGISKVLWLEVIRRISIAKAQSMSAIEPFLTILFAAIILAEVPTTMQLVGLVPMVVGLYLITR